MSGDWLSAEAKLEALRSTGPRATPDYWVSAEDKLEALRSTRLGTKPDYYGYEVSSSDEWRLGVGGGQTGGNALHRSGRQARLFGTGRFVCGHDVNQGNVFTRRLY